MASKDILNVRRALDKRPDMTHWTVEQMRAQYEKVPRDFVLPAYTEVEKVTARGVSGEWVRPPGARQDTVLLYFHGGGYVIGSPNSHRHLVAALCQATEAQALLLDYRLAPESPFPAAVDDATTAYRWLIANGVSPHRIIVAGDSAGGGLCVATLVALRDEGLHLPAAAVCISPWVDLTAGGASYQTKTAVDPLVTLRGISQMAEAYLNGADPRTPLASPLFADLAGLPPLLVQVGSEELLLDDARSLEAQAKQAGVDATLEVWMEMIHVWHWFYPMLKEGRDAIAKIGDFVRTRV